MNHITPARTAPTAAPKPAASNTAFFEGLFCCGGISWLGIPLCALTSALCRTEEGAQRRSASVGHQRAVRRQPVRLGEVFVAAQSARRSFVGIGSLRLTRQ